MIKPEKSKPSSALGLRDDEPAKLFPQVHKNQQSLKEKPRRECKRSSRRHSGKHNRRRSDALQQGDVERADMARTLCEATILSTLENPCGITKHPSPAKKRMHGNTITAMLACGRVAMIMPTAGHESLSQVFGMLAAVRTGRALQYVVYDNACWLARFVRNLHARKPSGTRQMCEQLTFVLHRWHKRNHTACLDPEHNLYMPEAQGAFVSWIHDMATESPGAQESSMLHFAVLMLVVGYANAVSFWRLAQCCNPLPQQQRTYLGIANAALGVRCGWLWQLPGDSAAGAASAVGCCWCC
eukprot:Skav227045  [mRNA]  locus=scaffold72:567955:572147:- [translate_table: standard]